MRVTVSYELVFRATAVLNVLLNMNVPGVAKIALRRFARHLEQARQDIEPERLAILNKYATVKDGEEPVFHDDDAQREANLEFRILQLTAFVELECIESSIFEHIEGEGVTALMLQLGSLVFDPDELSTKPVRQKADEE